MTSDPARGGRRRVSSRLIAWLIIVLLPVLSALGLFTLGSRRSAREVVFRDSAEAIHAEVGESAWNLGLQGIRGIELTGCRLELVAAEVRAAGRNGASPRITLASNAGATPKPGALMFLELDQPTTLQIRSGAALAVDVSASPSINGYGLQWEFDAGRAAYIFASSAVLHRAPEIQWEGVDFSGETPDDVWIGNTRRGLPITCQGGDGAGRQTVLTLIAPPTASGQALLETSAGFDVHTPTLRAPRGAIAIGNRAFALGAGDLVLASDFRLSHIRWMPGPQATMELALAGRSADVEMAGEQLVPSTLWEWSQNAQWIVFAAVLVVVLGELYAKLFDIALPT